MLPDYWVAQVREAVRFADCVRTLRDAGVTTFLEFGPDAPLTAMAQDTLGDEYDAELIPLLRADRAEEPAVVAALARLQVHGVAVDWPTWFAGRGARRVDLPTYAFQHEFYWPQSPALAAPATTSATADPGDQRLWAAVERGDADELAGILGLGEQEHTSLGSLLPALTSWRRGKQEKSLLDSLRYRVEWTGLRKPGPPCWTAPGSSSAVRTPTGPTTPSATTWRARSAPTARGCAGWFWTRRAPTARYWRPGSKPPRTSTVRRACCPSCPWTNAPAPTTRRSPPGSR